jgi:hypothetical protein
MSPVLDELYTMLNSMNWPIALLLVLLTSSLGCLETKFCNERGCVDQASITVRRADGTTPPWGLVMEVDGRRVTCQSPPRGAGGVICDDNRVQVQHREVASGRFEQVINFPGTPQRISVSLMADTTIVAQRNFELVYTEVRPNGEHCEPVCKQGAETWELPVQ